MYFLCFWTLIVLHAYKHFFMESASIFTKIVKYTFSHNYYINFCFCILNNLAFYVFCSIAYKLYKLSVIVKSLHSILCVGLYIQTYKSILPK